MDRNARILVRVGSALGGDGVGFVGWVTSVDVAVLEHNSSVAEYEVDSAINVTFSVELSIGVDVKGILVTFEATSIEYG